MVVFRNCDEHSSIIPSSWCAKSEYNCNQYCKGVWCEEETSSSLLQSPAVPIWSYECLQSPKYWSSLGFDGCGGSEQSPVNIPALGSGHTRGTSSKSFPMEKLVRTSNGTFTVTQSNRAPLYTCSVPRSCGVLTWMGIDYYLTQFHVHGKSSRCSLSLSVQLRMLQHNITHYGGVLNIFLCCFPFEMKLQRLQNILSTVSAIRCVSILSM
jgi:hypothetical protein